MTSKFESLKQLNLLSFKQIKLISFACSIFFLYFTYAHFFALQEKIDKQKVETNKIAEYNKDYQKLTPVLNQWQKIFTPYTEVKDMYSLLLLLKIPENINEYLDSFSVLGIEPFKNNGQDVNLLAIRLGSNSQQGLAFSAKSMPELISFLNVLKDRKDIVFTEVELKADKDVPTMVLKDFALLIRK